MYLFFAVRPVEGCAADSVVVVAAAAAAAAPATRPVLVSLSMRKTCHSFRRAVKELLSRTSTAPCMSYYASDTFLYYCVILLCNV